MGLEQRSYRILAVSSSDSFISSLSAILAGTGFRDISPVTSISSAQRALSDQPYDFILINSPLPDDSGIHFAIDTCTNSNTVVLMLINSELYEEVYARITPHGVLSIAKPITKNTLLTAIHWMAALRERLRKKEEKTISLEEKMKEIRLINRAKWLLIRELHMEEDQAHRYIEKQAMDQCLSKKQIAETIIRTYAQ